MRAEKREVAFFTMCVLVNDYSDNRSSSKQQYNRMMNRLFTWAKTEMEPLHPSERDKIYWIFSSNCHLVISFNGQKAVIKHQMGVCLRLGHCRFFVPGNTQKNLADILHQFWDKNDGKNICHWNHFQIPQALSELPANWPSQFSQKGWLGQAS